MMQEMIKRQIQNQVKFENILADSWFSSAENMKFIAKRGKVFIFELKENRLVTDSEKNRNQGAFERLERMKIPQDEPIKVWIKDLEFPVLLFKQVFTNKDGTHGRRFLVTNNLTLSNEQFKTLYKKRWGVEEYHKSLKQNASIGSSPAYKVRTQSNHIFLAIYAYTKLEMLKLSTGFNHFAMKTKIYIASMKTALATFQQLWENTENIASAQGELLNHCVYSKRSAGGIATLSNYFIKKRNGVYIIGAYFYSVIADLFGCSAGFSYIGDYFPF